ncbi:hypothetical protein KUL156_21620 [Alteromonas sp. KUL156]|nr:hypothetical protein KUL154_44050 [Alteromonas sp. KUL154]GFD99569.1 hypothetical protein KUL156_21620 [Alteromonas sp. KUL156]
MNSSLARNHIDTQRPDAPALSAYGKYAVGVKTLHFTFTDHVDVLKLLEIKDKPLELPRKDRQLVVELWYPADHEGIEDIPPENRVLNAYLRDGKTQVELFGNAVRDAIAVNSDTPFPLVIVSHGYPGNRYLLAHLAENIASKGYIVASIDHTDSTYRTKAAFASTLYNRPIDQILVLDQIEKLSHDENSFLNGNVDTRNTAIVGYSMGGYGAVVNAGATLSEAAIKSPVAPPFELLKIYQKQSQRGVDSRIKTVIAFAPWGMNYGVFTADTMAEVKVPILFVAGSQDDVSGYENGVKAMWKSAVHVDRALLTYENANHNAGAVMPAPEEAFFFDKDLGINVSEHYIDAVWDNTRMNNIAQHFATAWLAKYLKSKDTSEYLDLVPSSNDGVWALDDEGNSRAQHTYWKGFKNRTAKGLKFEVLQAK